MHKVKPRILTAQLIPAPHPGLLSAIQPKGKLESIGFLRVDFDHALFVALDEATKASHVHVLNARSYYATGEATAILGGGDDETVREGMKAALRALEQSIFYYTTENSPPIPFFAHVVSRSGEYLSKEAEIDEGDSFAYLMAPPVESMIGLDAALKSAEVKATKIFNDLTESNRGGAYVTGPLEECEAAAAAFAQTISNLSLSPVSAMDRVAKR